MTMRQADAVATPSLPQQDQNVFENRPIAGRLRRANDDVDRNDPALVIQRSQFPFVWSDVRMMNRVVKRCDDRAVLGQESVMHPSVHMYNVGPRWRLWNGYCPRRELRTKGQPSYFRTQPSLDQSIRQSFCKYFATASRANRRKPHRRLWLPAHGRRGSKR